jgi:hypothetical protein
MFLFKMLYHVKTKRLMKLNLKNTDLIIDIYKTYEPRDVLYKNEIKTLV